MTWPTVAVNTTNVDQTTDSPAAARTDLLDLIQKMNLMIAQVSSFMGGHLADTTAANARATLGAAASGPLAASGITGAAASGPLASSGITGAAASGANTDITSLASPSLANATAATQAYSDSSTKLATTAWAKAYGGLIGAQAPGSYSGSATMATTDLFRPNYFSSASAGTLTLPASPSAGWAITIFNLNTGLLTIARNGASAIYALSQNGVTAIQLGYGDSLCLVYDGNNWVQVLGAVQIGVGQSWQNVTGSRALGTTYTNSTGKPIQVVITGSGISVGCIFTFSVGGTVIGTTGGTGTVNEYATASFIVPSGATYTATNSSGTTLLSWFELR